MDLAQLVGYPKWKNIDMGKIVLLPRITATDTMK